MDLTTDSFRAALDLRLALRTLGGPSLDVLVRTLRVDVGTTGCLAEAELELDGHAYGRCLDEGLLGLGAPSRGPGPEPELGRPIQVVARLRAHFAEMLAGAQPDPMAALLEHVFTPPALFAHAEAWRATDVTQQAGDVGVSLGYRTVWAGEGSPP